MALDAVTEALKNLSRDDSSDETEIDYFCVEDCFLAKDVKVSVNGVGNVTFPINEDCVQKLIQTSSKAVFGRGENTVLDTNIRDTQTIPASKLKVDLNEKSLAEILGRIGSGLNIDNNCTLVPHVFNMLIYCPGQFFDKHRDSEKISKMIATLVIVLPSPHKGGDLIIEHNNKKHIFFGSHNPEIVKCIAFYSDCRHQIKKVTEGYRVALTFNVVLNSPNIFKIMKLDHCLEQAVEDYFLSEDRPIRLIFYMNHSYSKCSLRWSLLKGSDRTRGYALYVVAKHLGLKPCLALVEQQDTYEVRSPYCDDELCETSTQPYFWVSWHDKEFVPSSGFTDHFCEEELCYTIETSDLLEPYRTDKEEGEPYGNSPETEDRWYKRACVVLLRAKKRSSSKCKNPDVSLNCQLTGGETSRGSINPQMNEERRSNKTIPDKTNEGEVTTGTIPAPQTNEGSVSKEVTSDESYEGNAFKEVLTGQDSKTENLTIVPSKFYSKIYKSSSSIARKS